MSIQKNSYPNHTPRESFEFILVSALVINAFFLRGFEIGPISSVSYFIPILTLGAITYVGWSFRNSLKILENEVLLVFTFFILITISILWNILVIDLSLPIIQFAVEIYLNIFLFLSIHFIAKNINTQNILDILLMIGFLFSIYILFLALIELESVRRVGNTELPISVNHLSHALAVSFAIGACKTYYRKKHTIILLCILFTILTAMFFTGSRSGFLSIAVIGGLFLLIEGKNILIKLVAILGTGSVLISIISIFVVDFSSDGGLGRISYYSILDALAGRAINYLNTIEIVFSTLSNTMFGAGMHNYVLLFSGTPITPDPHNLWLSTALFFGLPAAILFSLLHLSILVNSVRTIVNSSNCDETDVALFFALVIVSIYSFFSGRMTRIFTIWIIMALVLEKNSSNLKL